MKTFDNAIINLTGSGGEGFYTMRYNTYRDDGLPLQTQTSQNPYVQLETREDIHKVKLLRDANGARFRGTYLEVEFYWDGATPYTQSVPLVSFLTKYRVSKRAY